uniref:Tub domain-containing protein n=2 Tax=Macrostomum lignano TaxID=282301 RepID=A0A1I8I4Z3_9PLAT
ISLPDWVVKEIEDYYTETGITRKTTPTDVTPAKSGHQSKGFYIGMHQQRLDGADSPHTLGGSTRGGRSPSGETPGAGSGGISSEDEVLNNEADGGVIKVTVSSRHRVEGENEADRSDASEGADDGDASSEQEDLAVSSYDSHRRRRSHRRQRRLRIRARTRLSTVPSSADADEADDTDSQGSSDEEGAAAKTDGDKAKKRKRRLVLYKEPHFFKPHHRKKLTVPKDPFSKNREFKMVRQSVIAPVSSDRKLGFIAMSRETNRKELKQFKLKPRSTEDDRGEWSPPKRAPFAQKTQDKSSSKVVPEPQLPVIEGETGSNTATTSAANPNSTNPNSTNLTNKQSEASSNHQIKTQQT